MGRKAAKGGERKPSLIIRVNAVERAELEAGAERDRPPTGDWGVGTWLRNLGLARAKKTKRG